MPLFSIIIPSYNQELFLTDNVESILAQDFGDWELLIVDDESTDGSLALAYELASRDERIRVLEKKNGGLSSSRNCGILSAKGQYLYFIDADDKMLPGLLRRAAVAAQETPDVIQFGYRYLLDKTNRIVYQVYPKNRMKIPEIFWGSPGSSHSFIVHRSMIEKAGFFDENLRSVEDWDYWLRVVKCRAKVCLINLPLVDYRQHELSMSRNYIVMYEAFREVALRAPNYDNRTVMRSEINRDYEIDMKPVIKDALLRFTALAVMQGKINLAKELFLQESERFKFKWNHNEFKEMNCYLTFRYRYSKDDLQWIFRHVIFLYKTFFTELGYDTASVGAILKIIFYYHYCNLNVHRYGFFGRVLNRLRIYPSYK